MAASEDDLRKFLEDVAEIANMSPLKPERIVAALRDYKDDNDRFQEWAQGYLDATGRPYGGANRNDAIKAELLARDEEVKRLRAEVESLRHALRTYERVQLAGRHEER